jgi:outer membrane protein assembly factor BamA
LEEIRFRNNRMLTSVKALRDPFPIKDGDVLPRDAIELGMRDLHRVYGEYGYIDLSSVPTTRAHEEGATVSFDIDSTKVSNFTSAGST